MSDWQETYIPGVTYRTHVLLEWPKVGKGLARQGSDDQAEFLEEFVDGIYMLGPLGGPMQVQYIADALNQSFEEDPKAGERMRWFLRGLLEGLTEDPDDD